MFQFGIGDIYAQPVGGNAPTPTGPVFFGTIQDASVEMDAKAVELRGQNQYPDDVAIGDKGIKGKVAYANIQIGMFNKLFYADTVSTGIKIIQSKEPGTVPGVSTYTITVVNHTVYLLDLGVRVAATGKQYDRVNPGSEVAGQSYSVNQSTGVYTFNSGDANLAVLISYVYTSASGFTMSVNNHLMGYGPTIEMWLQQPYQGTNGLHLTTCRVSKMSAPMKRDNYVICDFEFVGYPNTAGLVWEFFQITT